MEKTLSRKDARQGDQPPRGSSSGTTRVLPTVVKIIGIGIVVSLAVALTPALLSTARWGFLVTLWVIAAVVVLVYATGRGIPAKYLLPGALFLVLFVVYPILMTFQLSTTNYGDGTRTDKETSIARILASSAVQSEGARRFSLAVGTDGTVAAGPYTLFLVDEETETPYSGTEDGLVELDPDEVTVENGKIVEVPGYTMLTPREVNEASQGDGPLSGFAVPTEQGVISAQGLSAVELSTPLEYDEVADTITNTETNEVYAPQQAGDRKYFTNEDGERLSNISWGESVGLENYQRIFTDRRITNDFFGIFLWTLAFAILTVSLTFALGLLLASVLNDPRLRGQKLYRSILLLPYAIPGFISLLVWSGFYNRDFGLINDTLNLNINWFGDPTWAKVAVLATNLWMGFPYMFLVCTGALQAIPGDLKEAASLDGASGWTNFRKITFPLLLVSVAPLLVASFAFNFNNFNAIYLLTEGGPFTPANPTAGGTDILISYTYRLAFGTSDQQIGFASAISVILFILTGVLAAIQFRATRVLEEVG